MHWPAKDGMAKKTMDGSRNRPNYIRAILDSVREFSRRNVVFALLASATLAGCTTAEQTAVAGAAGGAIIGGVATGDAEGALVGAAAGAVAGYVIG